MRPTGGSTTAACAPSSRRARADGRPHAHGRAGPGELLHRAPRRRARGARGRPRRRGRAHRQAARRARARRAGDPDHAHALRPRRRGGAARPPDQGAGVVPAARDAGARRHHELCPVARLRPVRVLRRRPHRRRRREARAGRLRDRRDLHARPQPRPRELLDRLREGALLGRRAVPGVGRAHRPARGRLADARPVDRRTAGRAAGGDAGLPGPHGPHHARPRARHQPLPARAVPLLIKSIRGTYDVLGDDAQAHAALEATARRILERAGYSRIETPAFEATELFARGVGESTDIVQKEMYTIPEDGITLRPEGTAPVARAYLEHGMHKLPQPVKLWYLSSFFRRERPQKGRYRQFWQIGIEAIGSDDPAVDAEAILLLTTLLGRLGVRDVRLRLSSLGTPETRAAYRDELQAYLRANEDRLSDEVRSRIDLNPLRAFDADHPGTREVMRDAPLLLDRLEAEDRAHFDEVLALLDAAGVRYEVDPTLVRGLDYYTRTVFEFTSDALGAQSGVGGGGRYDGLIEQLGGPATPGMGWAAGIERILLAGGRAPRAAAPVDLFVAGTPGETEFHLASEARRAGLKAQLDLAGRSLKG